MPCSMESATRRHSATPEPVLVVDSLDTEPNGKPLLTSRSRFAAERVQFVIENQ